MDSPTTINECDMRRIRSMNFHRHFIVAVQSNAFDCPFLRSIEDQADVLTQEPTALFGDTHPWFKCLRFGMRGCIQVHFATFSPQKSHCHPRKPRMNPLNINFFVLETHILGSNVFDLACDGAFTYTSQRSVHRKVIVIPGSLDEPLKHKFIQAG